MKQNFDKLMFDNLNSTGRLMEMEKINGIFIGCDLLVKVSIETLIQ